MTNACRTQDWWYSADEVRTFVERLIQEVNGFEGDNRRRVPRRPVSVPVGVRPLGYDLEPVGDTQPAITANISAEGIGLWHVEAIRAKFVEVSMASASGAQIAAIAEVRHSSKLGDWTMTGAQFLFPSPRP